MASHKETIWCDGCGIEITWVPIIFNKRDYCCEDCAWGILCNCGERIEDDEYPDKTSQLLEISGY
jgi:hypothetical protein